MRWTPILSLATFMGASLALALPAAAAPAPLPAAAECGAPAHPMGLRAGYPAEAPWGPPPGVEHGMEAPMPPYLQGLSLSDEQQDRIFDLLHGQAPEVRKLARSLQKTHSQLRDLGFADSYDEAAARALADAHAKSESELALLRARTDHQILALLTAAQRQQVVAATPGSGHERPGAGHGGGCWH